MMIKLFSCFLVLALVFVPVGGFAMENGIAVVVNEDAISRSDVNERLKLTLASSRLPNKPEIRAQLTGQVIGSLIDEQLKLQEAARLEIEITPEEITNGFAAISGQNEMTPEDFRKMMRSGGIDVSTMERQIKSQIAWSKVVQADLRPQITITGNDVQNVLERYTNNVGKTEYLLAEIVLSVPAQEDEAKVQKFAQDLIVQARSGKAQFFRLAQQFSSAPGATKGGDLGWVQEGQLNAKLDDVLVGLEKGEIGGPLRLPGGYHILALRDKRVVTADSIPNEQQIRNQLGLERLERLQQRRIMDLKAAAFIDNRLSNEQ